LGFDPVDQNSPLQTIPRGHCLPPFLPQPSPSADDRRDKRTEDAGRPRRPWREIRVAWFSWHFSFLPPRLADAPARAARRGFSEVRGTRPGEPCRPAAALAALTSFRVTWRERRAECGFRQWIKPSLFVDFSFPTIRMDNRALNRPGAPALRFLALLIVAPAFSARGRGTTQPSETPPFLQSCSLSAQKVALCVAGLDTQARKSCAAR